MSKCTYKGNRKGTRECPALGGNICSRCCGMYRLEEINCPDSCVWLQRAMRNHRQKHVESGELFETKYYNWIQDQGWGRSMKGRFALAVDTIINGYLQQRENPEDHVDEVRRGVESLKRQRTGSIVSVEKSPNRLFDHLKEEFEAMEEVLPDDEEARVELEEEIFQGILDSMDYCEKEDISYSEFLSEFFDLYHLPGYNPVQEGNIYVPGERREGSSIIT